jgi:hypothetical protein
MQTIDVIAAILFITIALCYFLMMIVWKFVNILYQIEKDRFYNVKRNTLLINHLWVAMESLGMSTKMREQAERHVELELEALFNESHSNVPTEQGRDNSPGVEPKTGSSKKSPEAVR